MHRVELKVGHGSILRGFFPGPVPNAPCGVERRKRKALRSCQFMSVPNAPCGVESSVFGLFVIGFFMFLMHRVELKVKKDLS